MTDVRHVITNVVDDDVGREPGLFDDDDPFNLPPPLPPLSPQRDDDLANQDGDQDQTAGDGGKNEPQKKRRVNRSPRPKLDEARLCSDRGIPALQHLCDDVKFKGKGHEASDLKLLMQRYEYWAHRLFPKFPFADVVEQVENLGHKKLVQNCIKRIRRGEEDTVEDEERSDTEIGQNNGPQDDETPSQINGTPVASNLQTFGVQVEARNSMVILTPEQQERIRLNRERALAKRKAAQEKQAVGDNTQTGQTDAQTGETENAGAQSTENAGTAKNDDHSTESLAAGSWPSSQANDVEMEDETMGRDVTLPQNGKLESGTVKDTATSTLIAGPEEDAEVEDTEMGAIEADRLVTRTEIVENGDSVRENNNNGINDASVDNDLSGPVKDLSHHKDDSETSTAQAMEETPSSIPSSVDQSPSMVLNDEASQPEGCKETLDVPPTEQAPSENEPGEAQKMETETD